MIKSDTIAILINIVVGYFNRTRVYKTIQVIAILIRVISIIVFIDD